MLEINLNSIIIGNTKQSINDEESLKDEINTTKIYSLENKNS